MVRAIRNINKAKLNHKKRALTRGSAEKTRKVSHGIVQVFVDRKLTTFMLVGYAVSKELGILPSGPPEMLSAKEMRSHGLEFVMHRLEKFQERISSDAGVSTSSRKKELRNPIQRLVSIERGKRKASLVLALVCKDSRSGEWLTSGEILIVRLPVSPEAFYTQLIAVFGLRD